MDTDLQRYITAQDSRYAGYAQALAEIRSGKKDSHWMWYIFPQMRGLGRSSTADFYGISDLAEAKAYLKHEVLGPRLIEITEALLAHKSTSAQEIFGHTDALKLRSCMTLFEMASEGEGNIFGRVLDGFFAGRRDDMTISLTN